MKRIIGGLLGTAAGIFAVTGAQAADLPVKAKAVEYVKICSAYGAGFYYIPGTDICLRVGGFVRADYEHNAYTSFPLIGAGPPFNPAAPWMSREQDTHQFHTRVGLILDARQNTAYGTLRAYLDMGWNWGTGITGTNPWASRGFIQFAGFTFGRATSFYDFYGSTGPHANLVNWGSQTTGAGGHNVLAYTAQFGNGLSGTISLEDTRYKPVVSVSSLATFISAFAPTPTNFRAGMNVPAVVANLRVDQSWGSAQIMGAVQELRTHEGLGSLSSYGYAVGGGFTWNNPSAPGSQFGIQASWAKGATHFTASSYIRHLMPDSAGVSVGFLADGVVVGTTLHKTEAWGVNAGYQHRFSPNWAVTIHGAYNSIDYAGGVEAALPGFNLDYDFWSLGTRLLWTPVPGLDFGLDVLYHKFDTQSTTATTIYKSQDVWASMLRVIRNF